MLSCSIWFSAPSFWMGGGLESRCVGRVYGGDGAMSYQVLNSEYCKSEKLSRTRLHNPLEKRAVSPGYLPNSYVGTTHVK